MENLYNSEIFQIFWGSLSSIGTGFIKHLPNLIAAIIILVLTLFVARLAKTIINRIFRGDKIRRELLNLAKNLLGLGIWLGGFAIAAIIVFPSLSPANLFAAIGLGSVAIGFAFKDIFENFLAGIMILGREPMRIGDFIECEDVEGSVETILIRETHVRKTDGQLVILPNAMLFKNPVFIRTDRPKRRHRMMIGVDYGCDLAVAKTALESALDECGTNLDKEASEVRLIGFGSSSIDFEILWWTRSQPKNMRASYDELAFLAKRALDKEGISIPFPQTVLSVRDEVELDRFVPSQEG